MKGSSDHILSLVNDLLDFQRLESGEMEVHSVPFRVPVLFDEIYTSFQPIAEAKGLRFVLNLKPEETGQVYMGDPIRIRQVVGNLLSTLSSSRKRDESFCLSPSKNFQLSIINYLLPSAIPVRASRKRNKSGYSGSLPALPIRKRRKVSVWASPSPVSFCP